MSKTKIIINIENRTSKVIPSKEALENTVLSVLEAKKLEGQFLVEVIVVSTKEIHKLNLKYRKIDKPTDVLSFPIHEKVGKNIPQPVLLGDIVICPEMAEDSIEKLVEHSTLHLLGYHHKE